MKKKRTVIVITTILIIAFALSSISITFLPSSYDEDFEVIKSKKDVFKASQFKAYQKILNKLNREDLDVTELLDGVIRFEVLKSLGFLGSDFAAQQLYSAIFQRSDPRSVALALGVRIEELNEFFKNLAVVSSLEVFFKHLSFFSKEDAERALRILGKQFSGRKVILEAKDIPISELGDEVLQEYYESHLNEFIQPAIYSGEFGFIELNSLESLIPTTDELLEDFYVSNRNNYKKDDSILCLNYTFNIQDPDILKTISANTVEDLQKEFERLNLIGTQSSSSYSGQEFKNIFDAEPEINMLFGPVKSERGWSVCYVAEIKRGEYLDFKEVKESVKREYILNNAGPILKDLLSDKSTEDLEEFKKKFDFKKIDQFSGVTEQDLENIIGIPAFDGGFRFIPEDQRIKYVQITSKVPSRFKSFEELKNEVKIKVQNKIQFSQMQSILSRAIKEGYEALSGLKTKEVRFEKKTIFDDDFAFLLSIPAAKGLYGPFFNVDSGFLVEVEDIKDPNSVTFVAEEEKKIALDKLNQLALNELISQYKFENLEILNENLYRIIR